MGRSFRRCHLGNNSWQLGKRYERGEAEAALDLPQWKAVIDEFHTHLDANGIDASKEDIRLGAPLEFDAKKEVFTGKTAKEANAMLSRATASGNQAAQRQAMDMYQRALNEHKGETASILGRMGAAASNFDKAKAMDAYKRACQIKENPQAMSHKKALDALRAK